jgi:hypothetical protein
MLRDDESATDRELMNRAMAAYFRSATAEGESAMQPTPALSAVTEHEGKRYVVLENMNGVLAVCSAPPGRLFVYGAGVIGGSSERPGLTFFWPGPILSHFPLLATR